LKLDFGGRGSFLACDRTLSALPTCFKLLPECPVAETIPIAIARADAQVEKRIVKANYDEGFVKQSKSHVEKDVSNKIKPKGSRGERYFSVNGAWE
jgi:hypothetical protein